MREQSHLDEMRAAIRGDFERLERRRGDQELLHVREPAAEPEERLDEPAVSQDDAPLGLPPRSWLDRVLGR